MPATPGVHNQCPIQVLPKCFLTSVLEWELVVPKWLYKSAFRKSSLLNGAHFKLLSYSNCTLALDNHSCGVCSEPQLLSLQSAPTSLELGHERVTNLFTRAQNELAYRGGCYWFSFSIRELSPCLGEGQNIIGLGLRELWFWKIFNCCEPNKLVRFALNSSFLKLKTPVTYIKCTSLLQLPNHKLAKSFPKITCWRFCKTVFVSLELNFYI